MTEKRAMLIERDIRHILERLEIDGTKDDAELVIVYRDAGGPFRRVLLNQLPSGTIEPARYLTAPLLREICQAALASL